MTEFTRICIFCKKELEDSAVTVTKGLQTIIRTSIERKDSIHLALRNVNIIKVHNECRKQYTRPSNIKSAIQSLQQATTSQHCLRELENKFNFKRDCVMWGKC